MLAVWKIIWLKLLIRSKVESEKRWCDSGLFWRQVLNKPSISVSKILSRQFAMTVITRSLEIWCVIEYVQVRLGLRIEWTKFIACGINFDERYTTDNHLVRWPVEQQILRRVGYDQWYTY